MATEKLYKVTLIGLQADKSRVLEFLQHEGIMHINPIEELDNSNNLKRDRPLPVHEKIAENLLELEFMVDNLQPYFKKKKLPAFSGKDMSQVIEEVKTLKKAFHKTISSASEEINENNNKITSANNRLGLLKKIPFNLEKDTKLPHSGDLVFAYLLQHDFDDKPEVSVFRDFKVNVQRKGNYYLLQGLKKDKEKVDEFVKEKGFKIITVPKLRKDVKKEIRELNNKIKNAKKNISKNQVILSNIAYDHFNNINHLKHDLVIFLDRQEKANSFLRTEKTFAAEGYVPVKQMKILKKIKDIAKVHVTSERVKEGPTKLKNLPYIRNYAFITKMFGVPKYGRIDPTVYIAFFMPFFFGFMFSDIGYGFLLLLLSLFMFLKTNKQTPILTDAAAVFFTCSLSTMFFGLLFGSFFGNLIKITPILFDPFQNAKYILIASLAIGIIHMNIGLLIASYESLKRKKFKALLLDNVSMFSLQAGVVILALQGSLLGWGLMLLSVILLVVKSSLMGIMDITGFVGTWFSYARLLALSLATGGIALGINIMAEQLSQVKMLGPVLFLFLVIFGHLFNFVLNVLGSSIHSVRLHYIEFFSQFYTGGGVLFNPFTTKRVKDSF